MGVGQRTLVDVVQQRLLDDAAGVRPRVHQVVGVDDAHHVLELIDPRLCGGDGVWEVAERLYQDKT